MIGSQIANTTAEQRDRTTPRHAPPVNRLDFIPRADNNSLLLFYLCFGTACFIYFASLGSVPIFDPDEALYVEPAREMLKLGDYVNTYLNYEVAYTKPLTIWAIAACMKAFGVCEFAGRFLSAACGAVLVGITYLFAEKYAGRRQAILAAMSLAIAPLYLVASRLAITDIPLTAFVAGAIMSLFHGYQTREHRWKWLAYVLIGLGAITQGPVALTMPVMVVGLYHLVMGELRRALAFYNPVAGLIMVAVIALPWFIVENWVTGGEYFEGFATRENFQLSSGGFGWYHLAAMSSGYFPWSIALPFAWLWSLRHPVATGSIKQRAHGWLASIRNATLKKKALVFASVWSLILLVFPVFFSLSLSKHIPGTLPAFPAIAILTGAYLTSLCDRSRQRILAAGFMMLALTSGASYWLLPVLDERLRYCPEDLIASMPVVIGSLVAVFCVAGLVSLMGRPYLALVSFCASMLIAVTTMGPRLLDIFSSAWQAPVVAFSQYAGQFDRAIIVHRIHKPSTTYYAGRKVIKTENEEELELALSKHPEAFILSTSRLEPQFRARSDCRVITSQGLFLLVSYERGRSGDK